MSGEYRESVWSEIVWLVDGDQEVFYRERVQVEVPYSGHMSEATMVKLRAGRIVFDMAPVWMKRMLRDRLMLPSMYLDAYRQHHEHP